AAAAPKAPAPSDGNSDWAALDVQVCVDAAAGSIITNNPWTLVGSDNRSYEPSGVGYNQFPVPGYPFGEQKLAAGECVRGWIVFPVTKGAKIVAARYSIQAGITRWTTA
ncbi:MAG: hypothetical protein JWN20_2567, partial [Jatrophihabitantaceae bacterium]|nr:hypothetical protein [Jatrophihabitantaceae bacterium]